MCRLPAKMPKVVLLLLISDNNHLFLWVTVVEWTHGQGYLLKANTKLYSFDDFGNPFEN